MQRILTREDFKSCTIIWYCVFESTLDKHRTVLNFLRSVVEARRTNVSLRPREGHKRGGNDKGGTNLI